MESESTTNSVESEVTQNGGLLEECRTRNPNWSDEEKSLLIEEVAKRVDQLSVPRTRGNSSQKESAWEEVSQALTAAKVGPWRSAQTCRKKWENLKILARRAQKQVIEEQIQRGINVNNNDIPPDDDMRATVELLRAYQTKSSIADTANSLEAVLAAMQEHANNLSMENLQQLLALRGATDAEEQSDESSSQHDDDQSNTPLVDHDNSTQAIKPVNGQNGRATPSDILKEQLSSPPKNAATPLTNNTPIAAPTPPKAVSPLGALPLTLKNCDISLTPITNTTMVKTEPSAKLVASDLSITSNGGNSINLGAGITLTPAAPVKLSSSVTLTAVPASKQQHNNNIYVGNGIQDKRTPPPAHAASMASSALNGVVITPMSQHSKQIVVDLPAMRRNTPTVSPSTTPAPRGVGRPPNAVVLPQGYPHNERSPSYPSTVAHNNKMHSSRSSGGGHGYPSSAGYGGPSTSSAALAASAAAAAAPNLAALSASMMSIMQNSGALNNPALAQRLAAVAAAAAAAGGGNNSSGAANSHLRATPSPLHDASNLSTSRRGDLSFQQQLQQQLLNNGGSSSASAIGNSGGAVSGGVVNASAADALSRAAAETLAKRKRKMVTDEEETVLVARRDMYKQMTKMADDVKNMLEMVRVTESLKQRVLEEKVELLKLQRRHMQLLMLNESTAGTTS